MTMKLQECIFNGSCNPVRGNGEYKLSIKGHKGTGRTRSGSMRPGMYILALQRCAGCTICSGEIVDNAIDEAANGYADQVKITLHRMAATVEDNGRGIPVIHPQMGFLAWKSCIPASCWRKNFPQPISIFWWIAR